MSHSYRMNDGRPSPPPVMGRHLHAIPNLVVDILTPTTIERDLEENKDLYARCGVEEYGVFDPAGPSVRAWALEGGDPVEIGSAPGTGRVESRLLPGFSLVLEDIVPAT